MSIFQKDVALEKAALLHGEHDNFPKGATSTAHRFRKDVKLRNNEEMFRLSDDEIMGAGDTLTPEIKSMVSQCCRGMFHHDKAQLAKIFRTHGEGIALFGGAAAGDPEFDIPDDPEFGWQMQDKANGYPCSELLPNGKCKHHVEGQPITEAGKPLACKMFPTHLISLKNIDVCSYEFDGSGVRSGTCDGCKGKLGL